MTHPRLGWNNLRYVDDDVVHMAAFNGLNVHVTACVTAPSPAAEGVPHEVDAVVTCSDCLLARESDWWMAILENDRRNGDVSSLGGVLVEAEAAVERMGQQANAKVEQAMLYGTGDDQPLKFEAFTDYFFARDEVAFKVSGPPGAMDRFMRQHLPMIQNRMVDDTMELLARRLKGSPLAILRRAQFRGEHIPLVDPGAERVRQAIESAQETLAQHPFHEHSSDCEHDLIASESAGVSECRNCGTSYANTPLCLENCPIQREEWQREVDGGANDHGPFGVDHAFNAQPVPIDETSPPVNVIVHADDDVEFTVRNRASLPDSERCAVCPPPDYDESEVCESCDRDIVRVEES